MEKESRKCPLIIRFTPAERELIKKFCVEKGQSEAVFIRDCIDFRLKNDKELLLTEEVKEKMIVF